MAKGCLLLGAVWSMPCSAATTPAPDASSLVVQTQTGPVRGQQTTDGAARFWLGIPYAEPPVGDKRWQAPQPHRAWKNELQATRYGSPCPQVGSHYGPPPAGKPWGAANLEAFGKPVGSEDCLVLNVWRPAVADGPLPVLIFIHGGSNVVGHSGDSIYNGQKLALATGAVVVTLNYRLGLFGWFVHPALGGADSLSNSGNFGTLDVIQALRFMQANAAAFGGDPNNMTIMGESAGGMAVYELMGSRLTQGLFHKAIVLSAIIQKGHDRETGYAYAKQILEQAVIDDRLAADAEAASRFLASKDLAWQHDYLKGKTTEQLLNLLAAHPDLSRGPRVFNDGIVVSADLPAAVQGGNYHIVPTLVGMTNYESKQLIPVGTRPGGPERFSMMINSDPDAPATMTRADLISAYMLPGLTPWIFNATHWALSRYIQRSVTKALNWQSVHDPKVYAMRFDWDDAPEPWQTFLGACHACDLPFVFGNFSNNIFSQQYSKKTQKGREALSTVMMQTIGAFIRTGDPNHPALGIVWKPWSVDGGPQKRLILDASDQAARLSEQ